MLNNWQFCFTCSAFARTWKCDSKQGMTPRGAVRWVDFITVPLLMLRARPELHAIKNNPWRICLLKHRVMCGDKDALLLPFYPNLIVHIKSFPSPCVSWQQVSFPSQVYEGSNNSLTSQWDFSSSFFEDTIYTVWCTLISWICWTCWMSLKTGRTAAHSKGQWPPWVCEGGYSVCARAISEVK